MTAAPAIKGWCPTLLSPMQSGDGWLARVKPSAGALSAAAARLIADAARRHGNGHIDLTSRANLQIRGLTLARRKNSPRRSSRQVWPIPTHRWKRPAMSWRARLGPTIHLHPSTLMRVARDIEAMLSGEPALWALPSKFGVLVDGGGVLPLADITADIMVRAQGTVACRPPRWRDAGGALRSILTHRNREGSGARLPSPIRAAERAAAPHARAGDGGRRGGDFRRGRS